MDTLLPFLDLLAPSQDMYAAGDSLTAGTLVAGSSNVCAWAHALLNAKGAVLQNSAVGGTDSATILATMRSDFAANPLWAYRKAWLWMGENDIQGSGWDGSNTLANIASAVALAQRNWFRVMEIIPKSDGSCDYGTAKRTIIDSVNATLASRYGSRFVSGLYTALAAHGDGGSTDNADIAAGRVPTSLRKPADTIHMTLISGAPDNTTGNGVLYGVYAANVASGY